MQLPEETKAHGKWYDDACGTAFAMELVGERWSLLVVRELIFGPLRFSDLRAGLPGISAKVLTERLTGLEKAGIVARKKLPPPASSQVYALTPWGQQSHIAIMELGRWAAKSARHDPSLPLSPASLMMSFLTMFDRNGAGQLDADLGIVVAGQEFRARLIEGELTIARGPVDGAQTIVRAPAAAAIAAHVYGDVPLADLPVQVEGNGELWARFAALLSLPEKIG